MIRVIRWLPAIVWMSFIFYMSHQTGDELRSYFPFFHKLIPRMESFDWGHFITYFILALTYMWAFGKQNISWKHKVFIVFLCFMYGITDEYHQSFVDGRTPDWKDVRNDVIGAMLAMLIISLPTFKRLYHKLQSTIKY